MNENSEVITLEVDPEPAIRGAAAGNAAMDGYSKRATAGTAAASRAFEEHGGVVVRTSDRSRNSLERLTVAWEKQAQTYGKSGIQRIIAERDQLIQRLGNEEKAIDRVRAAAEKMMQAERQLESGGGSGFRTTFAIKGVKDVFEGRGTFAIAELVNELMVLKGSALVFAGIATGVGAIGFAVYELHKQLREIPEDAERAKAQFTRFVDEAKLSNAEMQVTNDRLQNTIAKLEHRPENNLKLAIDEAAVSAGKFAEKLDKSLAAFAELAKKNEPGMFAKLMGGGAPGGQLLGGAEDIDQLIQGKSGFGGMRGDLYAATSAGKDPTGVLSSYRQRVQHLLDIAQNNQNAQQGKPFRDDLGNIDLRGQGARIEVLTALLGEIDNKTKAYALEQQNAALTGKKAALEGVSGARDRVLELEKRSREAYGAAYFGEQTPYGKYLGAASKVELERGEFNRLNPGFNGRVNAAFDEQKAALWLKFLDESSKALERFNLELDASGNEVSRDFPNMARKGLTESDTALRNAGITDQHGNLSSALFGESRPAIPAGYVSPEQALRDVSHSEQRFVALSGLQASIGASSPRAEIAARFDARQQFADKEYLAQLRVNEARLHGFDQEQANLAALDAKKEKLFEAELERDQQLLEFTKRQFDLIKNAASSLFDTLFRHPSQFGRQLFSTVSNAALAPVTRGLGNMAAGFLAPMFGVGGSGGGGLPVMPGAGNGILFNSPGEIIAGGGDWGDGNYIQSGGGGGRRGGVLGRLEGMFPGGGGFGGILKNVKGMNWGGLTRSPSRWSMDEDGNMTQIHGSKITGVNGFAGAALMAGGGYLAQAGLLGGARGTGGGMLMGTIGGAAIGFALGGPLGAGIGAGAGFLIGLGEKLAGVESQAHQAHRLIMSIYHVDIPEQSGTMQQILQIASQYGSVSGAVRSSQARQLIEMYALALGRTGPGAFLSSPRSASLVQQGNTLYQGLNYFNGSGYSFQSSLPTLGASSGVIPTFDPYGSRGASFLQLDGPATTALLSGQVSRVATPEYVGAQNVAALRSGGTRFATMGAVIAPSTIFA